MANFALSTPFTWTATIKFPRQFRCKSRKRFVKLLMADGFDRNVANLFADSVMIFKKTKAWEAASSYQSFYLTCKLCGVFDDLKTIKSYQKFYLIWKLCDVYDEMKRECDDNA